MDRLRVRAMRLLYRVAYRILQLTKMLTGHRGNGVKCVLTHNGRILLVRHTYGRREIWYLPGGGVQRGEQPLAAGLREMNEELGLKDPPMRELASFTLRMDHMTVRLTCLHAELEDPSLHPDPVEIAQAVWFEADRLPVPLGSEVGYLTSLLPGDAPGDCALP